MLREPGIRLSVKPAGAWSADGPLADRALDYAFQFSRSLAQEQPFQITVERCAPEHAGLGTGTQLGLAVARALAVNWQRSDMNAVELARQIGRGRRSALGIHGFDRGGFLVDGGKGPDTVIAPLVARLEFPQTWHIVLVMRNGAQGLHGVLENRAFERRPAKNQPTETLCRLVLLGILPALAEGDLPAFGEGLYEFNRQVGQMFRPLQSGTYADRRCEEIVAFVRRQKVAAAGQSSWGPTVFAIAESDRALVLAARIRQEFGLSTEEVIITQGDNEGASTGCISRV
jgi:beta-RFAP synthase